MSTEALPSEFDPVQIEVFLGTRGLSDYNTKACMRVIKVLLSGEGVVHTNKPGEAFLEGEPVRPTDDLHDLQRRAALWLPHRGKDALDKGHGWALNHPIQKLIEYKNHLLGVQAPPKKAGTKVKGKKRDPMAKLAGLKTLLEDEAITQAEYDTKKAELLARI